MDKHTIIIHIKEYIFIKRAHVPINAHRAGMPRPRQIILSQHAIKKAYLEDKPLKYKVKLFFETQNGKLGRELVLPNRFSCIIERGI